MSRYLVSVLAVAGVWWMAGCERDLPSAPPSTGPAPAGQKGLLADDQQKISEGLAAQSELIHDARARCERELKQELERAETMVASWQSQLETAEPEARARLEAQIAKVKVQADAAKKKLDELKAVADEGFFEFRKTVNPALDGLRKLIGAQQKLNIPTTVPAELTTLPTPAPRYFDVPKGPYPGGGPSSAPATAPASPAGAGR